MSDLAPSLLIAYGSQTGNAESISKHLHEEALARGYASTVTVLDDYEQVEQNHPNAVLVIVISTTGDGDFPDNTQKFFRWTRRGAKDKLAAAFNARKFAVLALGDTNYTNFCQTGKRIERRLIELGAVTFQPKGLADDATGLEAVIDPWVANMWSLLPSLVVCDQEKARRFADRAAAPTSSILKKQKLDDNKVEEKKDTATETPVAVIPPATTATAATTVSDPMDIDIPLHYTPYKFPISLTGVPTSSDQVTGAALLPTEYLSITPTQSTRSPLDSSKASLFHLFPNTPSSSTDPFTYTPSTLFASKIVGHRYLTGDKALKRVLEVTLDVKGLNWTVPAGAVVGIAAPNPDFVVLPLLKRLGIEAETVLDVKLGAGETGVGALPFVTDAPYTAYEAFRYFLDLNPPLRKPFLRIMAEYASDEAERAALLFLTSTAGAALFKSLKQANLSLADLFATFPSVTSLPLSRLLESLTRLQPRFYSISRINNALGTISIAFNIVEYTNPITQQPVVGLCSTWLESLVKGAGDMIVPLYPKPNVVFGPPADVETPMVLVAAGTGITPFLSFLQARAEAAAAAGKTPGETVLFHGRRFVEADRIYGSEIDAYVAAGVVTRFVEVQSREEGGFKYVQDAVLGEGNDVWRIVGEQKGSLFVCGGVEMARDVHAAVGKICGDAGRVEGGDVGVKNYLKALTAEGRYLKEIWS
ncbi:riboflavin synthase domain-like protein [Rhizoclosmatium globosum]|uniref:Methionine synthase reductase n=1 Tax=Rhizoclosmatium globosum TaxID=329046 RepID=A0A1Y2BUJ4_9FUNG|nr:riboflavin synthase domain-like protein [Rhizoclosmatium globosum]|eukprot:ORY38430.1 riboflavin synthase domain-like protein [Rhizoclosmatium globosum]